MLKVTNETKLKDFGRTGSYFKMFVNGDCYSVLEMLGDEMFAVKIGDEITENNCAKCYRIYNDIINHNNNFVIDRDNSGCMDYEVE